MKLIFLAISQEISTSAVTVPTTASLETKGEFFTTSISSDSQPILENNLYGSLKNSWVLIDGNAEEKAQMAAALAEEQQYLETISQ